MPTYSRETQEWFTRARNGKKPYGCSYLQGTLLLTVVKAADFSIQEHVWNDGHVIWRAVDEFRRRKLTVVGKIISGRIKWDPDEPAARILEDKRCTEVPLETPRPHPEQKVLIDTDESRHFFVVSKGLETIESSCLTNDAKHRWSSRFTADLSEGSMPKRNWLLAIAEGVKGLPGGEVLLGPLTKLIEEERTEERNAQIDRMFSKNEALSERTLSEVLGLRMDLTEMQALVHLAVIELNKEFAKERGMAPQQLPVSEFPVPLEDGLVIQELRALWKTKDDIRTCMREHNMGEIDGTDFSDFVIKFVDSMAGNDRKKLAAVFDCLRKKRSGSKILAFIAEFLKSSSKS